MFEINFTQGIGNEKGKQEALTVKSISGYHGNVKINKFNGNCNYTHGEGHWIINCKKYPLFAVLQKTMQKKK